MTINGEGRKFYFQVCAPSLSCGEDNAACSISQNTVNPLGSINELEWSEKYSKPGEGISVIYRGDADCKGNAANQEFIVTLKCDASTEYQIMDFASSCDSSRAIIRSKYACPSHNTNIREDSQEISQQISDNTPQTAPTYFVIFPVVILSALVVLLVISLIVTASIRKKANGTNYKQIPSEIL
ncbi:MAG: hypothetical protein NXI00_22620 [Cytophagales bacterium]|nr:hypothetical protein [Cytophagales bacterium]